MALHISTSAFLHLPQIHIDFDFESELKPSIILYYHSGIFVIYIILPALTKSGLTLLSMFLTEDGSLSQNK
jgi:hypothetical protein